MISHYFFISVDTGLFQFYGHSHNLHFCVADEVEYVVAYFRRFEVLFNALECVEHGSTRLINVAIGLCDVVDLVVGEFVA